MRKIENNQCASEIDSLTGQIVYTFVDQEPIYDGGKASILKFFADNYKYPSQDYFQASFHLEFIINEKGHIIAPRIKGKNTDELTEAEKEVIRVLKKMDKWKPGKCNGESVSVKTFLPIKF